MNNKYIIIINNVHINPVHDTYITVLHGNKSVLLISHSEFIYCSARAMQWHLGCKWKFVLFWTQAVSTQILGIIT